MNEPRLLLWTNGSSAAWLSTGNDFGDPSSSAVTEQCISPWPSCLSLSEAFFTVAFMLTVMLLIVFGNLMVVLTVKNDQKLRAQRQNWLIVSLAIADLLVGLLIMPLTMIYEIVGIWVLGNVLCELWLAFDVLFVTASILHICIISLDRYWSVTQPLTYPIKRTPYRICVMIGVAWLVSLLICFPPLLGWKPQRNPGECSVSRDLGYVLYSSLGSFYIPVGILVIVYWRIFEITKHHSRQRLKDTQRTDETLCQLTATNSVDEKVINSIQNQTWKSENGKSMNNSFVADRDDSKLQSPTNFFANLRTWFFSPTSRDGSVKKHHYHHCHTNPHKDSAGQRSFKDYYSTSTSCTPSAAVATSASYSVKTGGGGGKFSDSNESSKRSLDKRRRLLKVKERQATLLLGLILTAFIVSWLPFFMMYVLGAFGYNAPILVFKFFFWLGYCNSAINPVIYTVFNREFKRALFRLLRRHQRYFLFVKQHAY